MIIAIVALCLLSNPDCTPEIPDRTMIIDATGLAECGKDMESAIAGAYPEYRIVNIRCMSHWSEDHWTEEK